MAGRFEGLSDIEWKLFSNLFPVQGKRGKGKSSTDPRRVLNTLLYLLFTGCLVVILQKCGSSLASTLVRGWDHGSTPG